MFAKNESTPKSPFSRNANVLFIGTSSSAKSNRLRFSKQSQNSALPFLARKEREFQFSILRKRNLMQGDEATVLLHADCDSAALLCDKQGAFLRTKDRLVNVFTFKGIHQPRALGVGYFATILDLSHCQLCNPFFPLMHRKTKPKLLAPKHPQKTQQTITEAHFSR